MGIHDKDGSRVAVGVLRAGTHDPPSAGGNRVADVMIRFPKTHSPTSRLEDIRGFFEDDHVHMALIVAMDGRLVTTIDRSDLAAAMPGSTPARELGTLASRTVRPSDPLAAATVALLGGRRRRLAVTDDFGRLLGLLCLKKNGTGYCSDTDIRERADKTRCPRDEYFQDNAVAVASPRTSSSSRGGVGRGHVSY